MNINTMKKDRFSKLSITKIWTFLFVDVLGVDCNSESWVDVLF